MLQSAPSSPSAFHHYESRRQSCSAPSPRFAPQVPATASTRPKAPCATSALPPAVPFAQSPQSRKREYKNASTQYSPTGFPPTYRASHPASSNTAAAAAADAEAATGTADVPEAAPAEPREPEPRIVPEPVAPSQEARRVEEAPEEVADQDGRRVGQQSGEHTARQEETKSDREVSQDPMSPAKRARPQDPAVKVMPLKYETCDVKDLGVLISDMLMEIVRLNEGLPLKDGQLTRFHSRAPPGISVRDYLNRIIVHATLSPPVLLSMVFYVDKMCTMYPEFTISSLTVHRFLITAATVGAKGLSDSFWTNSLYARVGGVSVRELGILELEFLKHLDWRIVPKPETLVDYYKGLVERNPGYTLEKEEAPVKTETVDQHQAPAPVSDADSGRPTDPQQGA